jgi:lipoprotein-anchoring transpeptidase ErfK/SrfK
LDLKDKPDGGSDMMFMVKLAALACFLSIVVMGVSIFLLNMSGKTERVAREQDAEVGQISGDLPGEPEASPDIGERDMIEAPDLSPDATPQAETWEADLKTPEDSDAGKITEDKSARRKRRSGRPDTVVLIDKTDYKLTVMKNGSTVKEYRVAVGKNVGDKERRGDMRTPEGEFKVQQFQDASSWKHDFGDGKGSVRGAYGPLFIRLRTPPWSGIGIHGTHDPASIGNNVTEGCVRMKNEELLEFAEMVGVGTRVIINP